MSSGGRSGSAGPGGLHHERGALLAGGHQVGSDPAGHGHPGARLDHVPVPVDQQVAVQQQAVGLDPGGHRPGQRHRRGPGRRRCRPAGLRRRPGRDGTRITGADGRVRAGGRRLRLASWSSAVLPARSGMGRIRSARTRSAPGTRPRRTRRSGSSS